MAKYKVARLSKPGTPVENRSSLRCAILVLICVIFCSTLITSCDKASSGSSNVDTHTVKADGSIQFNAYTFKQLGSDQKIDPEGPYHPTTLAYPTKWPTWLTLPDDVFIAGDQKKVLTGFTNTPDGSFHALKVSGVVKSELSEIKEWFKKQASASGFEYFEREPTEWVEDVLNSQDLWLTQSGSKRTVVVSLNFGKRWGSFIHFKVDVWLLDEKAK